jgi:hypothetical protein
MNYIGILITRPRLNASARRVHRYETKAAMMYVACGIVTIWIAGYLYLLFRGINLGRVILNNGVPGKPYRELFYLSHLVGLRMYLGTNSDPDCLNELGQELQKKAIWNERIAALWLAGGGSLLLYLAYLYA